MSKWLDPNLPAIFTNNQAGLRLFDRDLITALDAWAQALKNILDGGISLPDNVDCDVVTFTSSVTPDLENAVPHGLGKVPSKFIVCDVNKGAVIYRGATAFTKTNVYLKASLASVAITVILL